MVKRFPQVNITLSVHSPFPEQRATLIPLEKRFPLDDNFKILDEYVSKYKRRIYLAYLLIEGLNDTQEHLNALVDMVKSRVRPELYHISVIRYNNAFGANPSYKQPTKEKVIEFVSQLNLNGVHATKRTQFGSEIDAACGQFHAEYVKTKKRKNAI